MSFQGPILTNVPGGRGGPAVAEGSPLPLPPLAPASRLLT